MRAVNMKLFANIILVLIAAQPSSANDETKCEEITIPMCQGIGYNLTSLPNQFYHEKQEEAGMQINQFMPLVELKCSDDLKLFLCTLYTPICMEEYEGQIPPCRSVCERARHGCAPIMKRNGFPWPNHMNCNNFPRYGTEKLCMDHKEGLLPETFSTNEDQEDEDEEKVFTPVREKSKTKNKLNDISKSFIFKEQQAPTSIGTTNLPDVVEAPFDSHCQCKCRPPMVRINESHHAYFNVIETGSIINCVQPCAGSFFNQDDRSSVSQTINILAFGCLFCSLLVLFTFIIDTDRFRYPERAIICLAGCYVMVSLGFLTQIVVGREEIACDGTIIRYSSSVPGSSSCIVVFFLIYYFGMAAALWWVILTLTWFLSTGLQWGTEPLSHYSLYFHLIAWIIPGIKSFIIVASGLVDGEPLAGICFVGNQNLDALMKFIIVPFCIYLSIGFTLLLAGFISLLQIRSVIQQQTKAAQQSLDKLMIRIILFSILYIVPTLVVIGCNWREYHNRPSWEKNHNCPCSIRKDVPYVKIYLIKYSMYLMVGILTCGWILSGKTFNSWARCLEKNCFCDKRRAVSSHVHHGHHNHHHHHHHHPSIVGMGSSQRSYKQINYMSQVQSSGSSNRKISLSHV